MLRDCPFTATFWRKLGVPVSLISSGLDILSWLEANCMYNPLIKANGYPWRTLFTFAIWSLWKHRNRVVFENNTLNTNLHDSCLKQTIEYVYYVGKSFRTNQMVNIQVRWNKPSKGWFKLNMDRASFGNPGKARGARLIQDHRGTWIRGFICSIGFTTSIMVEFWALRDGLLLALQLGLARLEVELDAKVVVDLVLSSSVTNRDYFSILNHCR